jgi:hypothetical protein
MRSAPSTEFAALRERQRPVLVLPDVPPPRPRVISMVLSFNPQPKHDYVRSPALLVACRSLQCQHCGRGGEFAGVVGSHSNWTPHAKGFGIKASDQFIASLCTRCHHEIDQGSRLSERERKALWWQAHCGTVRLLTRLHLWPAGVPVPDTSTCPWDIA